MSAVRLERIDDGLQPEYYAWTTLYDMPLLLGRVRRHESRGLRGGLHVTWKPTCSLGHRMAGRSTRRGAVDMLVYHAEQNHSV